jgi:GNAT superfamily N-acetyltransferase
MTPVSIRTATPADLDAMLGFEQAIIAAERPFDPTLGDDPVRYYDLVRLLSDARARVVLADTAAGPIGCGFARLEPAKPYLRHREQAYLGLMYVHPDHRGQGVNRRIIDALKDWCRTHNISELRLDVYCGNRAAVRAYEKAGFSQHLVEMRMAIDR